MEILNSYIKIHLCGTLHQRRIGVEALKSIVGGGTIEVSRGFWQLDPLEVNTTVMTWNEDVSFIADKITRFCRVYQRYASQESIFIQVKDGDRNFSLIVYKGEWAEALHQIDRGLYLADWFTSQSDRYDQRDEYNPS